eukprot:6212459-Pleurochrysis_carterae.AAC.5
MSRRSQSHAHIRRAGSTQTQIKVREKRQAHEYAERAKRLESIVQRVRGPAYTHARNARTTLAPASLQPQLFPPAPSPSAQTGCLTRPLYIPFASHLIHHPDGGRLCSDGGHLRAEKRKTQRSETTASGQPEVKSAKAAGLAKKLHKASQRSCTRLVDASH